MFKIKQFIKKINRKSLVHLHPFFILLGVYFAVVGKFFVFLCYFFSALFHEFGHFLFARRCGYKQVRIVLMPYGAELCGTVDKLRYQDEIQICLGGPLFSFILAIVLVASWWLLPSVYNQTYELMISSLVCGIFNFLPLYPLDGGRLVVAALSLKMQRAVAIKRATIATMIFAILLFLLFIASIFIQFNITFGIVSVMMFISSFARPRKNYLRFSSAEKRAEDVKYGVEKVELVVDGSAPIYKLFRRLREQKYYEFVVVDANFNQRFKFSENKLDNLCVEDYNKTILEVKGKLL